MDASKLDMTDLLHDRYVLVEEFYRAAPVPCRQYRVMVNGLVVLAPDKNEMEEPEKTEMKADGFSEYNSRVFDFTHALWKEATRCRVAFIASTHVLAGTDTDLSDLHLVKLVFSPS